MSELEINKLAKMLSSKDREIRKLAIKIIENQYDLNFTLYEFLNINGFDLTYSLDENDGFSPIPYNAKSLIKMFPLEEPVYSDTDQQRFAKNVIEVIIEYNERKQNK